MSSTDLQLIDSAPTPAPGTFCSFEVNTIECRPIDYIVHNKQWNATDYKVITDHDGKYYPSDHLPVMVKLQVSK
jgi:endonuclease/exonuclease/phosphatase family metal-dependent hydrolase